MLLAEQPTQRRGIMCTQESSADDFKALALSGAIEVYDNLTGSDYRLSVMILEEQKVSWIKEQCLGGASSWPGDGRFSQPAYIPELGLGQHVCWNAEMMNRGPVT